jgi:anti-sigma B factor antagonist
MTFASRSVANGTIIQVNTKDLDSRVATEFKNALLDALAEDPNGTVIIDMTKVRFLDSTCLGALLAAFRQTGSNRKIAVAAPHDAVGHVFTVARVSRVIPVTATVDEALEIGPDNWPTPP